MKTKMSVKKRSKKAVPRKVRGAALAVAMAFMAFGAYAETVSISTYYPSPYGSYQSLETTAGTSLATTSGNVAIGTTTATEKLHVVGNALVTGSMTGTTSVRTANLRPAASNGALLLSDDSSTAARGVTIANGGGVGLGRSPASATYRLDVAAMPGQNTTAVAANIEGNLRLCDAAGDCGILRVDCNGTDCWPVYS